MTTLQKTVLLAGAGVAIVGISATLTSALLRLQSTPFAFNAISQQTSAAKVCTTIATDPNPPLNVRSSPVTAPDNVVGKLSNGTKLTVVDENEGWLRISSPIEGWVFEPLTVTSCVPATPKTAPGTTNLPNDDLEQDTDTLVRATELYHAGKLEAAVSLAQTISSNSTQYQTAQTAIGQWRQDWKTAENEFYNAQKALSEGRTEDVLQEVKDYPANRYWRERLTPLVKRAIEQQKSKS